MNRTPWIITLVVIGVGLAMLIGILGTRNEESKTQAVSSLSRPGSAETFLLGFLGL